MSLAASLAIGAALLLLAATVVLALILRRRNLAHRREHVELATQHEQALGALASDHQAELMALGARFEQESAKVSSLTRTISKGEKWDAVSRADIEQACRDLGIDAVLATHVVFPCTSRSGDAFVAEIDHLLLTEQGCFLIENKGWKGVIIDGTPPRKVHPSLAALIDAAVGDVAQLMNGPFAIQLTSTSASDKHIAPLSIRIHRDHRAPVRQVRQQAQHLNSFLAARGIVAPYFTTLVYYSHRNAQVHHGGSARDGSVVTYTVSGRAQLRARLKELVNSTRTPVPRALIESLAAACETLGADIRIVRATER